MNGDDVFYGGDGADFAAGGRGDDLFYGGRGSDKLSGGRGEDTFVFDPRPSTKTNVDRIADFVHGTDEIDLDHAVFSALPEGVLAGDAFKDIGVKGAKVGQDDRVIYDSKTGQLFYDPDGSGSAKALLFATLDGRPHLIAGDIVVI